MVPYYMLYIVWPVFGDLTSRRLRAGQVSDPTICLSHSREVPKSERSLSDLFLINHVFTSLRELLFAYNIKSIREPISRRLRL